MTIDRNYMATIIHKLLEDIKAKEKSYGMNGLKVQISFGLDEAQVLLDALLKAEKSEQADWVSVSEELPKNDGRYTVIEKNGRVGTYVFHKEGNSKEYWQRNAVAWQPSSQLPVGSEKSK